MPYKKTCLDPNSPKQHLSQITSEMGTRDIYSSVSFCSRCGSCQQDCPLYRLDPQETNSPRGRNQALRLILEGKLSEKTNRSLFAKMVEDCTLCGKCTRACAGKIPTAEHMLELQRALHIKRLPFSLQTLLQQHAKHPSLFSCLVRTGLLLRRVGAIRILELMQFTRLPAFAWLRRANKLLPKKIHSLNSLFRKAEILFTPEKPGCIYLPSLEAVYFLPDLALQTVRLLSKRPPLILTQQASGLFAYVYGDLRQSRYAVYQLIKRHAKEKKGTLPFVTDSIDLYNFLKKAPQLFTAWPRLQQKANRFAQKVVFIADFLPKKPTASSKQLPVLLEKSALFNQEGPAVLSSEKFLLTLFKKNLVQCFYTDAEIPAFGYGFTCHNKAEQLGLQTAQVVARSQAKTVVTLSGLSALEANYVLRRFYPTAKAVHIVQAD